MSERYADGFENVGTNAKRLRRILIDDELDALDVTDALLAPLASPTFTGTVVLPSTTSIGDVSATEVAYVNGVTSAIQTQMDLKAPLASPTFTGTVVVPTPFTIGAVSMTATGTELNYVAGVTSALQTQLNAKQAVVSGVDDTEIGYLNGVTSAIQTQIDAKAALASPTFTGTVALPVVTVVKGTPGTESTNAVTVNGSAGVITTSALTTAAAGSYLITLTNSSIVGTGSVILVSAAGGTNTTKDFSMEAICTGAGTATITIYNNVLVTTALNGTIIIHFMVV